MRRFRQAGLAALMLVAATAAHAAPICTDRPTKSNAACTVPAGHVQIEADALAWTANRSPGERSDQFAAGNATIKLGLGPRSDLQWSITGFTRLETRVGGAVQRRSGIGDMGLRLKQRLTAAGAPVQAALLPFVKLPTAPRGLGNGRLEGGLALPVNIAAAPGWTITLGPQLDILANAGRPGHHAGITGLVNVARQFGRVTLAAEIWASRSFDPAGPVEQISHDLALAWLARDTLQFDIGAHVGLNRQTPDLVAYLGISTRF